MSDDQLRSALATLDGPAAAPDSSYAALSGFRRRRTRRRRTAVVGAVAAVGLVAGLLVWSPWRREAPVPADPEPTTTAPSDHAWQSIGDAPLSPRTGTVSAWTGSEMLVAGGLTSGCPPTADCMFTEDLLLSDGAAYDPATDSWRAIAPAPVPLLGAISVWSGDVWVVLTPYLHITADGGVLVSSAEQHLLLYDPATDDWAAGNAWAGTMFDALTMAGPDLLVLSSSDDELGERDQFFDLRDRSWETAPRDPFGAGFDRSIVWTGSVLVLAELDSSDDDPTFQLATLRPGDAEWTALPASPVGFWGTQWHWFGDRVVNPSQQALGASAQASGALDLATGTWEAVPQTAVDVGTTCAAPAVGAAGAWLAAGDGVLVSLDPAVATTMPSCGGRIPSAMVWTGDAFVIWGGTEADGATATATGGSWAPPAP